MGDSLLELQAGTLLAVLLDDTTASFSYGAALLCYGATFGTQYSLDLH